MHLTDSSFPVANAPVVLQLNDTYSVLKLEKYRKCGIYSQFFFVLLRKSCVSRLKSFPPVFFLMGFFSMANWKTVLYYFVQISARPFYFLIHSCSKYTKIKRKKKTNPKVCSILFMCFLLLLIPVINAL